MEHSRNRAISIQGRIVVFDYGEVISVEPSVSDRAEIVQLAGIPAEAFWPAYWRQRTAFDHGTVSATQYWEAIEREVGASWAAGRRYELWLADFRSWLAIDRDTLEVILDLERGGTRMAMLSNAAREFASYYRHGMLGDLFEQVFTSSELGFLKPQPEIFEAVVTVLGARPAEIVFIDNLESNVRGAEAVGITAHHYTDAVELRAYLERLSEAGVPYSEVRQS